MKAITTNEYEVEYSVDEDGTCVLECMTVKPEYRGQGYARKAMQHFLDAIGNCRVELCAYPQDDTTDQDRLVGFYESFWFNIEYDTGDWVLMYRS